MKGTLAVAGALFVLAFGVTLGGMMLMDRHAVAALPAPAKSATTAPVAPDPTIDVQAALAHFISLQRLSNHNKDPKEVREFEENLAHEEHTMRVAYAHGALGRVLCAKTITGPSRYVMLPQGEREIRENVSQPLWEKAGCADAVTADSTTVGDVGFMLIVMDQLPELKIARMVMAVKG